MNDNFYNNNVDTNQTLIAFKLEGFSKEIADTKILFIGNSITRHEVKKEIGWTVEWGMAASKKENDYVHQVIANLDFKFGKISFATYNCGKFEIDYTNADKMKNLIENVIAYNPDIIVYRLGENFNKQYLSNPKLDPYCYIFKLLFQLKKITKKIIVTSLFWANELMDNSLSKAAKELDLPFIKINDLGEQDKFKAIGKFSHEGICMHPNDLGMKEIASRITEKINNY